MKINYLRYFSSIYLIINSINIHANLVDIINATDYQQLINQNQPIIIKFAADWCGVCQGIKKPFQNIAQEKEFNSINFAQVDIDIMKDLGKQHNIAGVPTFVYIQNGKQVNQEVGVQNMVTFEDDLRSIIRKTFNLSQNNERSKNISTSELIEQNGESLKNKEAKKTEQSGILSAVANFIEYIIEFIKNAIKYIVDKITGIFR